MLHDADQEARQWLEPEPPRASPSPGLAHPSSGLKASRLKRFGLTVYECGFRRRVWLVFEAFS